MSWILEVALLLVGIVAAAWLAGDLLATRRREQLARRVSELSDETDPGLSQAEVADRGFLYNRLRSAGVRMPVPLFLAMLVVVGLVVAVVVWSFVPQLAAAALLAGLLSIYLIWILVASLARRRAFRFEERLVDVVDFMAAALRAGENPTQALDSVTELAERPVQGELRALSTRLAAGIDIKEAIDPMVQGFDSEGVRLFSQTLIIKWRTGGDLAEVLEAVARIMRERIKLRLRLKAELAAAQMAAVIMAVLPYILLPVFLWRQPHWLDSLFQHPIGLQLLLGAILLQIAGMIWLRRVLRVDL